MPEIDKSQPAAQPPEPEKSQKPGWTSSEVEAEKYKKVQTPPTLAWGNIENVWRDIRAAKESKDPAQWETAVGKVRKALEDWLGVINRWPDLARKYKIIQAVADRSEGEKKQAALDTLQKLREIMPVHIRKAIDAKQAIVPLKAKSVDDMLHTLEGIRQGDWDSYPGPLKAEIGHWEQTEMDAQHKLKMQIRDLYDRLDGVKDEERKKKLLERQPQVEQRIKALSAEVDREAEGSVRHNRLVDTIKQYDNERKSIARRLKGTQDPEARAKLQVKINEAEMGIKTPERIKEETRQHAKNAKYDALMWLVTNIAHPEKVLKTKEPIQAQPVKPKYMPPVPPEETMEKETEVDEPKPGASECRIFLSMINEGVFDKAKAYWLAPFTVSTGDLVIVEDGRKGRIRTVGADVVVDLFDRSTINAGLHQIQRYM